MSAQGFGAADVVGSTCSSTSKAAASLSHRVAGGSRGGTHHTVLACDRQGRVDTNRAHAVRTAPFSFRVTEEKRKVGGRLQGTEQSAVVESEDIFAVLLHCCDKGCGY